MWTYLTSFVFLLFAQTLFGQLCSNPVEPMETGEEIVFAEAGGVQLISKILTPPCEGFSAVKVEARASREDASLVTLTNFGFMGAHQVWSSAISESHSILGAANTPDYHPDWSHLDSHFLFSEDVEIGAGVYRVSEANDGFTTDSLNLAVATTNATAISGHGATVVQNQNDALFLTPEYQQSSIDLAYLVAANDSILPVRIRTGVLGTVINDAGTPNGAEFGYVSPIRVPGLGANVTPPRETVSIIGPERIEYSFGDIANDDSAITYFPFSASPAPDTNAEYGVELVSVQEIRDEWNQFHYGFIGVVDSISREIPAGTTFRAGGFGINTTRLGEVSAEYRLAFSDGTTVDALLSANVVPRSELQGDCETTTVKHGEVLVDRSGCVEIVSIPQKSPAEGLAASKIVARSMNPHGKIVTLTNLSFSNVHQVWVDGGIQSPGGTAFGRPQAGSLYHEEWIAADSHFLISKEMIAGGVYGPIAEQNDGSNAGLALPTVLDGQFGASAGFGEMSMDLPTDAFFLHPEFQKSELDIAYIVRDPDVPVSMTIGLFGQGFVDAGTRNGAEFGVSRPALVPLPEMVPEPSVSLVWILACLAKIRSYIVRRGGLA